MNITRKQIKDTNGHLRNTSEWAIDVDSQSEKDLKDLLSWVKSTIGNLKSNNGECSKKQRSKDIFESCMKIYNSDISHLYEGENDSEDKFYVYAHCDPSHKIAIGKHGITTFAATIGLTYRPFYIGMGQNNRAFELDRNESHRKYRQKIQKHGADTEVKIIKNGLSRGDALALESKLIDIFGLIVNKGYLVNLDEGKSNKERRILYSDDLKIIGRLEFNK